MDTKSIKFKEKPLNREVKKRINKKRNIFTAVVAGIMLILSLLMIYRYHYIEVKLSENESNPFERKSYAYDIFYSDYYLYFKRYQFEQGKLIKPSDLYLADETIDAMIHNVDVNYYSSKLDNQNVKESFNNSFDTVSHFIMNSDGNLKYNCINLKTDHLIGNYDFRNSYAIINDYEEMKKSGVRNEEVIKKYDSFKKEIQKRFMNFIVIKYNEKGDFKLLYCYGIKYDLFNNYMMDLESNKNLGETYSANDVYSDEFSAYKIEPIKDTAFIYAIPNGINTNFYSSYDSVSDYINRDEIKTYDIIESMAKFFIISIVIITILIPGKVTSKFRGINTVSKVPIEIIIAIVAYVYYYLLGNKLPIKIVRETIKGNLLKTVIANGIPLELSKQIVNLMNLIYWFSIFMLAFVLTAMLKKLLGFGIRNYFRKHSLIYRFLKYSYSLIYNSVRRLLKVDFKKRYNRLFLMGLIVIGIGTMCYFFADFTSLYNIVILTVLYVFVLIIYFRIVYNEIRESTKDYEKLLELTEDITKGNLDKNMKDEDVGVYEEIKRQLMSIQQAYKKSVAEEVKSQKMKSELISNVSHDLKTPLTSIITYADLLKSIETEEPAKEYIDTICRKSERLKILIDDMFEISKAQTGNINLDIQDIDVVQLMKQSVFEVEDRISEKGIHLKVSYPEKKVILPLDGEKTYRIFENLLVNIAKYAMPETRAYIEFHDEEMYVRIEFKNVSETEIDYDVDDITERFRRGDKSRNTEGSGLGLSIAKSYLEAQGGKLELSHDGDLFKATIRLAK